MSIGNIMKLSINWVTKFLAIIQKLGRTSPLETLGNRVVMTKLFMNSSGKSLFMFVCLANKPKLSISLGSTIKQTKLKHNNVFVNKFATKHAQFNYI